MVYRKHFRTTFVTLRAAFEDPQQQAFTLNKQYTKYRFFSEQSDKAFRAFYLEDLDNKQVKTSVLIGLYNRFARNVGRSSYFKPISNTENDSHIQIMKETFNIPLNLNDMIGVESKVAQQLIAQGKQDTLLESIYDKYFQLQKSNDFILVEGVPYFSQIMNAQIASALSAPIIFSKNYLEGVEEDGNSQEQNLTDIYNQVKTAQQIYKEQRAQSIGFLLNRVPQNQLQEFKTKFENFTSKDKGILYLGGVPRDELILSVRQSDVVRKIKAQSLTKNQQHVAEISFSSIVVASQGLEQLYQQLEGYRNQTSPLVLTSTDRMDVVFGLLLTNQSSYVGVGGVILCGPKPAYIKKILEEAHEMRKSRGVLTHQLPIYHVDKDIYEVIRLLQQIQPTITPTSFEKIEQAKTLINKNLNLDQLRLSQDKQTQDHINPRQFQHILKESCRTKPQRIVLPEGNDPRVLQAAHLASQQGLAYITVFGQEKSIMSDAQKLGLDFSRITIIDHAKSDKFDKYVDMLVEARKHKNLKRQDAAEQMMDIAMYGTMMVLNGDADGMVSGACNTTANTIRPGLQVLKNPKRPTISSVFFMLLPDKVYVYGDCAVNVDPNSDELAHIAVSSAETAAAFGFDPRVAMLSFSTMGSGSGPQVDKVIQATEKAKKLAPNIKIEGPLQYDAAVDPSIASKKVKDGVGVAGRANVLIFPDLNTGNNSYKAVQQSTGGIAMGPIMQGWTKPVNDLSRGCTVNDIVNTICATSAQAQYIKSSTE